jgi:DNA modification methylase
MEKDIKLLYGDCLKLIKDIPDNSIDLIVTDPPYLIETKGGGICGKDGIVKQFRENHLDTMKDGFDKKVLDEICRVLKKINVYFFCSQKQIMPLLDYFVKGKKCNWNLICWHKTNPVPACGNKYLTDTEFILFFREKGVKVYGEFKTKFTYYVTQSNKKDKKQFGHPTIKPLNIVQNLITNSSREDDTILDLFMGSGTTGVACLNTNRKFIGMEVEKDYFDIAVNRITAGGSNE